jgi:hypothetical protein
MLDRKITTIASNWVDGALGSRDLTLDQRIGAKQSFLSSRGMLISGAGVHGLAELANEELRTIAATSWTALMNALRAMPPAPSLELQQDVDAAFVEMLASRYQEMLATLGPAFEMSSGGRKALVVDIVQSRYKSILQQYAAEVMMWAAAYERSNTASPASATYVFNSPVGSLQTGAHSVANVTQNLGSSDLAPLSNAVREFATELQSLPAMSPQILRQGTDLGTEIERELSAAEPNPFKLRGLFSGLSAFVQSIGAAPAAWGVIQSIATALGLM